MKTNPSRLTVAFNGDIQSLAKLAEYSEVESVFGKLPKDIVGGGRETFGIAEMNLEHLKECIEEAHRHGLKFVYLYNAACLSNLEFTRKFNKQLFALTESLVRAGVDAFVVVAPYLLDFLKRNFPEVSVSISTFAIIDSPNKAKRWEDRGADRLILSPDVTRNFRVLRRIRESVQCELEIYANCMCMYQCPFPCLHAPCKAHASSSTSKTKGFYLDYYSFQCASSRLENPVEFVRGNFIRPEDAEYYHEIGIDVLKLSDRFKSTDWIVRTTDAYANGRYDGNLADIIAYPYMQSPEDRLVSNPVRQLLRPEHVSLKTLEVLKRLGAPEDLVYIDNRELDGFLEFFKKNSCDDYTCDVNCRHCQLATNKAVTVQHDKVAKRLEDFELMFDMLGNGTAFEENSTLESIGATLARLAASSKSTSFDSPSNKLNILDDVLPRLKRLVKSRHGPE